MFNSPPAGGSSLVGSAAISFQDCNHGTLNYRFFYDGPQGSIPLTRLTAPTTCTAAGDSGVGPPLSGAWYDPATSGQGLVFDFSTPNLIAAGWYTFAPGRSEEPSPAQRWYTLQGARPTEGNLIENIGIYAATGGVFDYPQPPTPGRVGPAPGVLDSGGQGKRIDSFNAGSNAGLSGAIPLRRLGTPRGCL